MRLVASALFLLASLPFAVSAQPVPHVFFRITMPAAAPASYSGRLLVFVKQGSGDKEVAVDEFRPSDTWVAAAEVHDLAPGTTALVDADAIAFPHPFAQMPPGHYEAQAVLDPDHTYNYSSRNSSDWIGPVVALPQWSPSTPQPALTLDHHPAPDPAESAYLAQTLAAAGPGIAEKAELTSPLLTAFWGHPTQVRAWVILPPGYAQHPSDHYPTVFWAAGFGGTLDSGLATGLRLRKRMEAGSMPPMIWVMLDESCPQGTHEFADSVNNGPWGAALTTEFLPMLEARYRMDARRDGRFLNGHSSGGWATLQLQVNYPSIFGGTWSTSPDSSDFHNFTGPDLYAPHANVYRRPDGSAYPIMRDKGKVLATLQQFSQLEQVLGPYGGQMTSFDWVFSPRSPSGAPQPMFDRITGDVDPAVVAYWHDHYDLAHIVESTWPQRGALLKGRIHLFVGTADTFYLDGAAHLFEARLKALGGDPHFTYIPNRTHFDLYETDSDRLGLFDLIATQMYAIARPNTPWKPKPTP